MTATVTATPTTAEPVGRSDWHTLGADDVCRQLDVDPAVGLSAAEVVRRGET